MGEKQYYTPDEIHYMDSGVWTLGDNKLRHYISNALSKIPKHIVDTLREKCYFLLTNKKEKATYFRIGFFDNKSLIVFSDCYIVSANYQEIERTILHEVAHFSLNTIILLTIL